MVASALASVVPVRVSALERLLVTERVPRRSSKEGGFARPLIHERTVVAEEGPFLVTNNRAAFVPTRMRPGNIVWAGFSEVPLGQEDPLVRQLFSALWRLSEEQGWANRCTSLRDAMPLMQTHGHQPRNLVVPVPLLGEACGQTFSPVDADQLMLGQGHVAKVGDLRILAADLRPGTALLFAAPSQVGSYVRSDQALAAVFLRVDRSVILVDTEARDGVA